MTFAGEASIMRLASGRGGRTMTTSTGLTAERGFTSAELAGLALFRTVDLSAVEPLLHDCDVRELAAGQTLIRAGEPNRFLYMLLGGRLGVHVGSIGSEPIATIESGDSVGEISLIDNQPASAHVVALCDSRVLLVDEELMWLLADTSHAISSNLLNILARRMRYGNNLIHQDREQLREYRFHATIDSLTGLFNRYWLNKMLPRQMQRARISGEPLAALMIDIDHFKQYNDQHGHLGGDQALASVAQALRELLRPVDMSARYGGEEFLVLLPGTGIEQARPTAGRLVGAVPRVSITRTDGTPLPPVTLSIGVGEMTAGQTPDELIDACDRQLYAAKIAGRNRFCG